MFCYQAPHKRTVRTIDVIGIGFDKPGNVIVHSTLNFAIVQDIKGVAPLGGL